MEKNFLKSGLLFVFLMVGIVSLNSCSKSDDLPDGTETNGKPRNDYGYLANGKRIAKLEGTDKYSSKYKFTYNEAGVIKQATNGYYTYTFSDDLSTVMKERANGSVVVYSLFYNKQGNLSAMGNVSTNDVDTKNITSTFLYENGVCVGVKNEAPKTIDLNGEKYTQGYSWLDGCPLYNLKVTSTGATLRSYTCNCDNPYRQNSYILALCLWSETDVRSILQVLGFLGDGPSKLITEDHRSEWSSRDGIDYIYRSPSSGEITRYHYSYELQDNIIMGEFCRDVNSNSFRYTYE